jgi:tetratricopeptide (TPR) repeat protein
VTTLVALADRLRSSLALLLLEEERLPRETALSLLALARTKASASSRASVEPFLAAVEALAADADDLRIECQLTRGDLAAYAGELHGAERGYAEALDSARRQHLRTYEPRALLRLAELALRRTDRTTARQRLDEALPLFRGSRTLRSIDGSEALILHGRLLITEGKYNRAFRVLEEVAEMASRHDLPRLRGKALQWIGQTHRVAGQLDRAVESMRRAKDVLSSAAETIEFADVLYQLGMLYRENNNLEEAQSSLQEALRIQERIGATAEQAVTLNDLAEIQLRRHRLAEAQRTITAAHTLARKLQDPSKSGRILVTMARVARANRRWKAAANHLRDAVALFKKAKLPQEFAETARELGMLLKERGEHAQAANYLAIALSFDRPSRGNPENENLVS